MPQTRTQQVEPVEAAQQGYPFELAALPYDYDALEPWFDEKTLRLHHRGHHATYVKKLNEALGRNPDLQHLSLEELLADSARLPAGLQSAIRNNGGGHLNHDLFWNSLAPGQPGQAEPTGALAAALTEQFGSFEAFRDKFSGIAEKHFASGWVALARDRESGNLAILDLADHEVVPRAQAPLLILDVWEHAYYLKYQNRRAEFIAAFWNVANWPRAAELFARASAG